MLRLFLIFGKPGLVTSRQIEIRHSSEECRADSGRLLEQEIQGAAFIAAEQIFSLLCEYISNGQTGRRVSVW